MTGARPPEALLSTKGQCEDGSRNGKQWAASAPPPRGREPLKETASSSYKEAQSLKKKVTISDNRCVGGGEPVTILRWKASILHGTDGGISMLTQSSTRITSLCCALSTLDRAKSKEMTRCCRKRLEQWTPRGKNTRLHHRTNFNTKVCMCLEVYCVTQQKEETTTWHVILTILTFQSLSALLTV